LVQSKSLNRGLDDYFHLMLGHVPVSFVIDSFDFAAVFQFSNRSPEINDRSHRKAFPKRGRRLDILFRRFQMRLGQQNLRNGICHAFESLVTM